MIKTKTCSHCKKNKPISDFYTCRAKSDGLTIYCKPCFNLAIKKYRSTDKYRKRRKAWLVKYRTTHHCYDCGKIHPNSTWRCTHCSRKTSKRSYKRIYNISEQEITVLFNHQKGKCAICKTELKHPFKQSSGKRIALDHSHKTGKIRGFLCYRCNVLIGWMKDSSILAKAIATYLEK